VVILLDGVLDAVFCILALAGQYTFCAFDSMLLATFVDHRVRVNDDSGTCPVKSSMLMYYSKLFSITYSSG